MKQLFRIIIAIAILLPASVGAGTTVYDRDWSGWQSAVGNAYKIEDFNDATLNSDLSVSTDNGYIDSGVWSDALVYSGTPTYTTWTFANPILAFGGTWDLAGPGGLGSNIEVYTLNGSWVSIGVVDSALSSQFWGFATDVPFTKVRLQAYNDEGWRESYTLDNLVYSYPLENYVTGGGYYKSMANFAGVVGFVEGMGIIGNFQYTGRDKVAWHCSDFDFLYFTGPEATKPAAIHNTAVFKGKFTNNRDANISTTWVKIVDNGEGRKAPRDTISFSTDGTNWTDYTLSGGNFQIHNMEEIAY